MGTNKQPEELLEHIKLSVKSNVLFFLYNTLYLLVFNSRRYELLNSS